MRKTDKKIDNQIRIALTDVCEIALKDIDGFQWLTHRVDYQRFPESLQITCMFDSDESLGHCLVNHKVELESLIQGKLESIGVRLRGVGFEVE